MRDTFRCEVTLAPEKRFEFVQQGSNYVITSVK